MELIKELGVKISESIIIPNEHKEIVLDRIEKSKKYPNRILEWKTVKNDFKLT